MIVFTPKAHGELGTYEIYGSDKNDYFALIECEGTVFALKLADGKYRLVYNRATVGEFTVLRHGTVVKSKIQLEDVVEIDSSADRMERLYAEFKDDE